MTLKELLLLCKNNQVDIYLYDRQHAYYGCYPKKYLLKYSGVLNEKIKSFKIDDNDLYIQLDF